MIDLEQFSKEPGVYLMKDAQGAVLYVGKAKNLKKRIKNYFSSGADERPMVPLLIAQVVHIDTIITPSEKEALLLENTLIKRHRPKYNALLKDDKTFISLMINRGHPWPMIKVVRVKGAPKSGNLYFGPYPDAAAARHTFDLLTRLFPLRQCSDEELKRRTRPCLLYAIGRCIAPCVAKCTSEQYQTFVQGAIDFLQGRDKTIVSHLKEEMERASTALEFEKAASLRNTIEQIKKITAHKPLVVKTGGKDSDAFGFCREGGEVVVLQLLIRSGHLVGAEPYSFSAIVQEDDQLLESFLLQHYKSASLIPQEILLPFPLPSLAAIGELLSDLAGHKVTLTVPLKGDKKELIALARKNGEVFFAQEKKREALREDRLFDFMQALKLSRYPKRIECFDVSHHMGTDLVASMVAFTDGAYDKARGRLFKIQGIHKGDDYGALHQVLTRRLIRAKEEDDLPDLLLIDGGKGQLHVALEVFKELDIASVDAIAVAKEAGRHDKGMTQEQIFLPHRAEPILLSPRADALLFLQRMRDAVHEKAIAFHRKRRQKRLLTSPLDALPGIGPTKRKALLSRFGSWKNIQRAPAEELALVKGITKRDVETIVQMRLQ